jgi:hypothetical protein
MLRAVAGVADFVDQHPLFVEVVCSLFGDVGFGDGFREPFRAILGCILFPGLCFIDVEFVGAAFTEAEFVPVGVCL